MSAYVYAYMYVCIYVVTAAATRNNQPVASSGAGAVRQEWHQGGESAHASFHLGLQDDDGGEGHVFL